MDVNECIDFINDIKEEKVFVVFSGILDRTTVSIVHFETQASMIYIYF
jgi:hypothetical protein